MADAAEDLVSSTESTQDVDSSSSEQDVGPQSFEDAITSVIGEAAEDDSDFVDDDPAPEEDTDTGSSPDGEDDGSDPAAQGEGDPQASEAEPESYAELLKKLRSEEQLGTVKRFTEVLEHNQTLEARVGDLEKLEQQMGQLTDYARQAGISEQQLANWYAMPAMLANEPAKARELLTEFMDELNERQGHTLPDDLRQKVDEGYMDEASASELARTRAEKAELERRTEYTHQQTQEQQQQTAKAAIVTAVNTRQQHYQQNDPDYSPQKHRLVQNELAAMVREKGPPTTPEQAAEWADTAYKSVSETLGQLKPKPRPARPISGRGGNRPAAAEPKSMKEAIAAALNVSEE